MEADIRHMLKVWENIKTGEKSPASPPGVNFNEILSSIFSTGPFYYYIIDFSDMSISHLSIGFSRVHGRQYTDTGTINDILELIHPDDADFVTRTEKKALDFFIEVIGAENFTRYKGSYNFRMRQADGSYSLFNHQALALTLDDTNKIIKSLNIHTDISHLTQKNNYKFSLIGLAGEPSYLNMDVYEEGEPRTPSRTIFTRREIEIIKLIAEGHSTKTIADKFYISPATAETHRKNILRKSGCENSVNLVVRSMSEGWI